MRAAVRQRRGEREVASSSEEEEEESDAERTDEHSHGEGSDHCDLDALSCSPPPALPCDVLALILGLSRLPPQLLLRHAARVSRAWRAAALRCIDRLAAPSDVRAVALFPALQDLTLTVAPPAPLALPATLRTLHFAPISGVVIYPTLAAPVPPLTALGLGPPHPAIAALLDTLLPACSASLQSLSVGDGPPTPCLC